MYKAKKVLDCEKARATIPGGTVPEGEWPRGIGARSMVACELLSNSLVEVLVRHGVPRCEIDDCV
jgi:hypothetical protein